jgi:cation:H+ antiporter
MGPALLQFVLAAGAIIVAGAALTRYADAIADLTRLGRLLIGSVLLAAATSLPELMVDINAVRFGLPDLAVGDLVGSSLFNLLILGLIDLTHHAGGQMLSRTAAAHALSGTVSIALTALVGVSILAGSRGLDQTLGGIGVGCLTILVAYAFCVRLVFYDQRVSAQQAEGRSTDVLIPAGRLTLPRAITGFLLAAIAITVAGPFLAESAGQLAELTGLGTTFVGSTLVAFCTSLPELVATAAAIRIRAFDLAIGNIYGSNAFNMVLLVPLDLAYPGSLLATVSRTHAVTCLCTVLITSIVLMGQLYQVEKRIRFVEPDALLVIVLVVGSLTLIYCLR